MKVSLYKIFPLLPNKKESFYALLWGKLEKITQEIAIFLSFSPQKTDRLYRWDADYDRPINRPFFSPIIGRLIGIGRTLLVNDIFTPKKLGFDIKNSGKLPGNINKQVTS